MRAVEIEQFGDPSTLQIHDVRNRVQIPEKF